MVALHGGSITSVSRYENGDRLPRSAYVEALLEEADRCGRAPLTTAVRELVTALYERALGPVGGRNSERAALYEQERALREVQDREAETARLLAEPAARSQDPGAGPASRRGFGRTRAPPGARAVPRSCFRPWPRGGFPLGTPPPADGSGRRSDRGGRDRLGSGTAPAGQPGPGTAHDNRSSARELRTDPDPFVQPHASADAFLHAVRPGLHLPRAGARARPATELHPAAGDQAARPDGARGRTRPVERDTDPGRRQQERDPGDGLVPGSRPATAGTAGGPRTALRGRPRRPQRLLRNRRRPGRVLHTRPGKRRPGQTSHAVSCQEG
ncbi:hypothetical protein [Streptomyces sp. NBC_01264]|uniref:hypothetical protein n=1 Tax=Streptomyces sp. NBC_01264 TaxID=2903804 RepID=UPI00338DCCD0